MVIAGNDCDVATSSVGTQGHCYYISHGNNIKVFYNIGRGAPGYGVHIFDQRRSANDIVRVISNVLVEGNLLAASPLRSGLIVAMGDEDGNGNHIDGITIRNNLFVANNHVGAVIGSNVRNVKIYHNTFYQNGGQGVNIYDEPSIRSVEILNNLFDQTANTNCSSNCSWFPSAHVQKGARAQNVAWPVISMRQQHRSCSGQPIAHRPAAQPVSSMAPAAIGISRRTAPPSIRADHCHRWRAISTDVRARQTPRMQARSSPPPAAARRIRIRL